MITDIFGTPATSVVVPAGQTSASFFGQIYPFTGSDRGTTFAATYAGITRSVDVLVFAQQQASLERHDAILCASLALANCLSDTDLSDAELRPTPLAVGDSSGYSLYTPELHLLAETEVSTASTKTIAYSYLWFGDIPVASVETATNTTRWYATDHLGTPLILTDASGAVAWRAEYTPYGDVYTLRAGASLHQPLRFPGQIAQDGSSLNYNVFRWYRSGWGRFTQADPLSLAAGMNLYRYAGDNPVDYTDALGLVSWSKVAPVFHGADHDTVFRNCKDWAAHGCTDFNLHSKCDCQCSGGSYGAIITLSMDVTVWARNDDREAPLTQILYEETKHVWYLETSFRWAVSRGERLEAKKFPTKSACKGACKDFYSATRDDFSQFESWVHENNPHPF